MLKRSFIRKVPIFLCLLLTSCSTTAASQTRSEAEIDVKWPIYKIEKNNQYMYLLGTIHIGKVEMYPFPIKISQALKESKFLVTETDAIDLMNGDYHDMCFFNKDESLSDYLSTDAQEYLEKRAKEYSLDYHSLQKYRLWYVMSLFLDAGTDDFSSDYGVDQKIMELADTYHLTNKFLETPKYQIEAMQKVYSENEAEKVIKQIPSLKESQKQLAQLYTDYIQEKLVDIEEQLADEFDKKQNKILVEDRNKIWVEKFASFIESGEIYFAAVGSGHLEGENGILTYFRENGYEVKNIVN
ncbi:TraB/GumN family protein [Neobacillus sp. NPDC058068]|uniref:TraB/GumN family protein n=1 Tax=Neobacillus sp. NPDC058068 TaxID=3346325 RepID=UPI0036DD3F66